MKKVLLGALLCLTLVLSDNTCSENVLKSSIGSNEFGVAFVGVAAALLIRGGDKK